MYSGYTQKSLHITQHETDRISLKITKLNNFRRD